MHVLYVLTLFVHNVHLYSALLKRVMWNALSVVNYDKLLHIEAVNNIFSFAAKGS